VLLFARWGVIGEIKTGIALNGEPVNKRGIGRKVKGTSKNRRGAMRMAWGIIFNRIKASVERGEKYPGQRGGSGWVTERE